MFQNGQLRLFLSSTFRDLQAERDVLLKKVFPALRKRCRERGVEFTEIDLRWGLTEEDAKEGRIIRNCLAEVDRSRPFFLGIIGDRYGWVPTPQDYALDPALFEDHPFLQAARDRGASITEIEFEYALHAAASHDGLHFYAKQQGSEEIINELAPIMRLLQAYDVDVRTFSSPDELAEQVERDLANVIDRYWSVDAQRDQVERERDLHEAFALSRRRSYIPIDSLLTELNEAVESQSVTLVVGDSGSGKSALLAHWSMLQRAKPETEVIEHYVGADPSSAHGHELLRRIVNEIRKIGRVAEPVPVSDEALVASFSSWLTTISTPLIVVIDAVDQIAGVVSELTWLLEAVPVNVKFVISCTSLHYEQHLRDRKDRTVEVRPLEAEIRTAIIQQFLEQYGKRLEADLARDISLSEECGNPLFLRTVLEELRLFGTYEELRSKLNSLLASIGPQELFAKILERVEHDFGAARVRHVLSAVWAMPGGISETELLELARVHQWELSRNWLSSFIQSFEYHLVNRGGSITFFHKYLYSAVEHRYCAQPHADAAKRSILKYLEGVEPNPRSVHASVALLQQLGDIARLTDAIAMCDRAIHLMSDDRKHFLLGVWHEIEDRHQGGITCETYASQVRASLPEADASAIERALRTMEFLNLAGRYNVVIETLPLIAGKATELASGALVVRTYLLQSGTYVSKGQPSLAKSVMYLAQAAAAELNDPVLQRRVEVELIGVLVETSEYAEAEPLSRHLLEQYEQEGAAYEPDAIAAREKRARILMELGHLDEAESQLRIIIDLYTRQLGKRSVQAAHAKNELAGFLRRKTRRFDEAVGLHTESLEIMTQVLGSVHPMTMMVRSNLATAFFFAGRNEEADRSYRQLIEDERRILGEDSTALASTLNNYGIFLRRTGDSEGARNAYMEALAIREKVLGLDHDETTVTLHNIGVLLRTMERLDESINYLEESRVRKVRAFGPKHPRVADTLYAIAKVKKHQGHLTEPIRLLEEARDIFAATEGKNHHNYLMTVHDLGVIKAEQHDYESARELLEEVATGRERTEGKDHPETVQSYVALADIQEKLGYPDLAFAIRHRILGAEHPDTLATQTKLAH